MRLSELSINGSPVAFNDQPEGLADAKILFKRDPTYHGFLTEIDLSLTFRCGSGKEEIDAEFDERFIDGIGEITISEICGGEDIEATFTLDFTKYVRNSSTTTIGLIEVTPLDDFRNNLKNDIEVPASDAVDLYIRNIPIEYNYYSEASFVKESLTSQGQDIRQNTYTQDHIHFYPTTDTTINELEDGVALTLSEIAMIDYQSTTVNNYITNGYTTGS